MTISRLMQMARAGVPSGGGDVWTDPDLANASYDSVSFSVAGEESNPYGLFFKPDGSKMYVVGATNDTVYEYNLSSAWDITTASYSSVSFSVSSQEATPQALFFKPDGLRMYIVGSIGDAVNEYSLSSAWDVSTAAYVQNFSVSAQESAPSSLFFKLDGSKMYISGTSDDEVLEYNLGTSWDISTSSYSQALNVAALESAPQSVFFNPDGDKMYLVGATNDTVYEYDLSSAWDITTASYSSVSFSVGSQDGAPATLVFKDDGTKMYILGRATDTIYQYSTA